MMASTLQRVISRRGDGARTVHVAVVGVSGAEAVKGATGPGKSCLCNRFVRSSADAYNTDHISVLSQSDFGGRVINNEHFVYWGGVSCGGGGSGGGGSGDDGTVYNFQVIEQTEFVDDASFQPFGTGKMADADYIHRCAATRLSSPDKLMYVCKNQLGIEREYDQIVLPDGRFNVDGFLCVFDVSEVNGRPLAQQVEFTAQILASLVRTRRPVVLATSKNDEARLAHVREAERLASRREFRGNIPLVETSAQLNVNVELAFVTLAQLVERSRGRVRLVPYAEAVRLRRHLLAVLAEAFDALLRLHVRDHRVSPAAALQQLQPAPQLSDYVAAHGTRAAHHCLQRHLCRLRDQHDQRRVQRHLPALARILETVFGDGQCVVDCEWSEVRQCLRQHPQAARYFSAGSSPSSAAAATAMRTAAAAAAADDYHVDGGGGADSDYDDSGGGGSGGAYRDEAVTASTARTDAEQCGVDNDGNDYDDGNAYDGAGGGGDDEERYNWRMKRSSDVTAGGDTGAAGGALATAGAGIERVPLHVLDTACAEMVFRNFVNAAHLHTEQKQMCAEFGRMLSETSYVTPGRPLCEVRVLFLGRACYEALSEPDRQRVYEQHQRQLLRQARADFQELLLERPDLFYSLSSSSSSPSSSASAGLMADSMTHRQLESLCDQLQNDNRFRCLDHYGQDRSLLLLQHAAFVSAPRASNCPAGPLCVDLLAAQLLLPQPQPPAAAAGVDSWCFDSSAEMSTAALMTNDDDDDDDGSRRGDDYSYDDDDEDGDDVGSDGGAAEGDDSVACTAPPPLNVAIVGLDSCSERLDTALLLRCDEDEIELNGDVYRLQTVLVDCVSSLTDDDLRSRDPVPHGCICVFSDRQSLAYLRQILHANVVAESPASDEDCSGAGGASGAVRAGSSLPLLVLFTPDPDLDPDEWRRLLDQGNALATSVGCAFVDGTVSDELCSSAERGSVSPPDASSDSDSRLHTGRSAHPHWGSAPPADRLTGALCHLLRAARRRGPCDVTAGARPLAPAALRRPALGASSAPDIRIMLCLFCGDPYSIDNVIGPILSERTCQRYSDTSLMVETFLGDCRRRVELMVVSYHDALSAAAAAAAAAGGRGGGAAGVGGADQCLLSTLHGAVLVYSAERRASLNSLTVLGELLAARVPLLIVAVVAGTAGVNTLFTDRRQQQLVSDGNSAADRLTAHFITAPAACPLKLTFYLSFFCEVWQRKAETERYSRLKSSGRTSLAADCSLDQCDSSSSSTALAAARRPRRQTADCGTGVRGEKHMAAPLLPVPPVPPNSQRQLHSRLAGVRLAEPVDGSTNQHADADDVSAAATNGVTVGGAVGGASGAGGQIARRSLQHDVYGVCETGDRVGDASSRGGIGGAEGAMKMASTESLPSTLCSARVLAGTVSPAVCDTSDSTRSRSHPHPHPHHAHHPPHPPQHHQQQQQQQRERRHKKYARSSTVSHDRPAHAQDGLFVYPAPTTPPEPAPSSFSSSCSSAPLPAVDKVISDAVQRLSAASDQLTDWHSTAGAKAGDLFSTNVPARSPSSQFDPPGRLKMSQFSDVADVVDKLRSRPLPVFSATPGGGGAAAAPRGGATAASRTGSVSARPPLPHRMLAPEYAQVKDAILSADSSLALAKDAMAARVRLRHRQEIGRHYTTDSESDSSDAVQKKGGFAAAGSSAPSSAGAPAAPLGAAAAGVSCPVAHRSGSKRQQRRKRAAVPVCAPRVPPQEGVRGSAIAGVADSDTCSDHSATTTTAAAAGRQLGASSAAAAARASSRKAFPAAAAAKIAAPHSPHGCSSPRSAPHGTLASLQFQPEWSAHMTSPVTCYKEDRALRKDRRQTKEEEKRRVKEETKLKKIEKERLKKEKCKKSKSSSGVSMELSAPPLPQSLCRLVGEQVPPLLARCVALVEAGDGLVAEGLYRVPGSRADVDQLLERLTAAELVGSAELAGAEVAVSAAATALKEFIGKRLEPLIPPDRLVHLTTIAAIPDRRTRLFKLRVLLRELPPANFNTLKFLFRHFVRVTEQCRLNSMDSKNLAICWWPTLVPLQFSDIAAFETIRPHLEDLVQSMIDQTPYLFDNKEERMMV